MQPKKFSLQLFFPNTEKNSNFVGVCGLQTSLMAFLIAVSETGKGSVLLVFTLDKGWYSTGLACEHP